MAAADASTTAVVSAAESLTGTTLQGLWRVTARKKIGKGGTGQTTSCCYEGLGPDGHAVFIKAFDIKAMLLEDDTEGVRRVLNEFQHEVEALKYCAERKLSRVTRFLAKGVVPVDGEPINYLVTEYAPQGSVREHLVPGDESICSVKRLYMLRDVAASLAQLHGVNIAHQDVKPSNAVCWPDGRVKLTDLGSSSRAGIPEAPPHDGDFIAGQDCYAPYELLYRDVRAWNARRLGCDLFLLGGLVFTTFTGIPLTLHVIQNLDESLRPANFGKEYREVLPDILDSHRQIVGDFMTELAPPLIRDELIQTINCLCHPDPAKRGHPKNVLSSRSQFSLEQYISAFNRMARTLEVNVHRRRAYGQ